MEKSYILDENVADGLEKAGVKLGIIWRGNAHRSLGTVLGLNLNESIKQPYVIHVPAQEEYDKLIKLYEAFGKRWLRRGEERLTEQNYWTNLSNETCLHEVFEDCIDLGVKSILRKSGYDILTLDSFLREQIFIEEIDEVIKTFDQLKALSQKLTRDYLFSP